MYVKEKYNSIISALSSIYNNAEAQNIATILLQTRLENNSLSLIANQTVTDTQSQQLSSDIAFLLKHKPMQYILEEAWFYKYPFYVNKAVLIPRPETELLVEICINEAMKSSNPLQIIDVGTGSGCIAISIKKELPYNNVMAIDISKDAINVAQKNASILNAEIDFIVADILQKSDWSKLPIANIIVSNPPYIPLSQKENMNENVLQYEPHQALFVPNNDPLLFYKALAELSVLHNATLCCEISEYFGEATKTLFQNYFSKVRLLKDYEDKDRFIIAHI